MIEHEEITMIHTPRAKTCTVQAIDPIGRINPDECIYCLKCQVNYHDADTCVLPENGEQKLFDIILEMKSVDVMKFAITKLYNPLAGRDVFGRGTGMR